MRAVMINFKSSTLICIRYKILKNVYFQSISDSKQTQLTLSSRFRILNKYSGRCHIPCTYNIYCLRKQLAIAHTAHNSIGHA
jgi:hypothetical protein